MAGLRWRRAAAGLALACLSGCASFSSLVPGQTTAAQVEAALGAPDERQALADGGSVWFYAYPVGRRTHAVMLDRAGVVRAHEERLTRENMHRIRAGEWRTAEVRALLGPPHAVARLDRQMRDVWEYNWTDVADLRVLWVQFSYDGVVRELLEMHDFRTDPPGGEGFP